MNLLHHVIAAHDVTLLLSMSRRFRRDYSTNMHFKSVLDMQIELKPLLFLGSPAYWRSDGNYATGSPGSLAC